MDTQDLIIALLVATSLGTLYSCVVNAARSRKEARREAILKELAGYEIHSTPFNGQEVLFGTKVSTCTVYIYCPEARLKLAFLDRDSAISYGIAEINRRGKCKE